MIPGLANIPYKEILRKMDLPSLADRRTRGGAIEVYKYLHGIDRYDCSDLLPLNESFSLTTRHSLKLAKKSSRTRYDRFLQQQSCQHVEQPATESGDGIDGELFHGEF